MDTKSEADTERKKIIQNYLSEQQLIGLNKYKYNSVDSSVFSIYVMHPFWNQTVKLFPKWVAPNTLTFCGFLLTLLNFILFSCYDYKFYSNSKENVGDDFVPRWLWYVSGVNLFVAYTLDGIDGKQARRTSTSGPLGELFDHGLDSLSTILIPICLLSAFGRYAVSPFRMHFILFSILFNFYLTHWEKYITGVMFLPWGYDFTMITSSVVLLVSGIITCKGWNVALPYGLLPGHVFEIIIYIAPIISSHPVITYNIYKSYRDNTGKMLSFTEAVRPLLQMFYFLAISTIWIVFSPNNIIDKDPRIFYTLIGIIFSNICCRLIVSQMSDTRCELLNTLLYLYTVSTTIAIIAPVTRPAELSILYVMFFLATLAHLHYGIRVVYEMCSHFKIRCFKIKVNS